MTDSDSSVEAGSPAEEEIQAMLERVAAAMADIEEAKRERSADDVRAARTHLAALHGVAQLRRQTDQASEAA